MSEPVEPGRRERKKRATRAALSEAALRLGAERGLAEVTVEQIADAADVSPRTFFNYFSGKEEAVVAGQTVTAQELVAAVAERPDDEPVLESLRAAMVAVVDRDDYRDRARLLWRLRHNPALAPHRLAAFAAQERALAEVVGHRIGADPDRDVYPTLVAAACLTGMRVAVQRWLADGDPEADAPAGHDAALPRLVSQVVTTLDAGLGTVTGRATV